MDVKDYEKYAKARNQARWECHKAKKTFECTLAKAIFSYVNSKLKTKTGIADLDIETGKATTDSEKAVLSTAQIFQWCVYWWGHL